ncbi:leucyl aminopeptidase [Rubrivivax gelatinosus]|uniref:Probable cytosol aminopeptidase n=1 Tax=Rubrivivax gelatinosus TaxID=28068 RepID=A0ABS1DYB6_RUBGE|nr:leucyl aminopeptidase [Rubrivivax gelatinosus]MBK1615216.1 leucyl aminopeptidase [Rubrivivax gelatinosus]MBK1715086.1 leucyl aminopeptidase [Rubrivivax gelatinosus]
MDFKTQVAGSAGWGGVSADALLVVLAGASLPQGLPKPFAAVLDSAVEAGDFVFKPGHVFYAHRVPGLKAARLAVVAAGEAVSAKALRKAVAAGVAALKSGGTKDLAIAAVGFEALDAGHGEAVVAAVAESLYLYRATKPSAPAAPKLASVTLVCSKAEADAVGEGLRVGRAIAAGVELARECANRPGNYCTPTYLAQTAKSLGKEHGLKVEVLERKDVEKLGMGSFLAVAQGSDEPLKFIVARWQGAAKAEAPVVLVGKGITFDSGGISLKPGAEMDEMKFDMGGAASVLGTMRAVAELGLKLNVVAIVPACENLPSGRAVKPGDVVTSLSGQTIEILNTDAEGRLILCDALTYAERFKPAAIVDVATLTGACVIALGHHRSGLFSPDDALAAELLAAGEAALDPAWRLPLDEEYDEGLKSNFADMGNVGPRAGGSITAAMFLKRFTAKQRWAHLDIAGTAWKSGAAKGATGRPVPLLTHFLLQRAAR